MLPWHPESGEENNIVKKRKQGHLKIGCLCKQPHKSETEVINQLKGTSVGKMPQNTGFFYLSEESLTQQILFQ